MFGSGILKGMGVVLRHFLGTYADDWRWIINGAGGKYWNRDPKVLAARQGPKGKGAMTVMYPDEKMPVPEEFRFTPFLVYEEKGAEKDYRCTSCGICAKVCPPQCIWIERTNDPKTGRPVPQPREFHIDIDICMNCGFCAEFCPFDAIKMDHNYEMASYNRTVKHIMNKEALGKPLSYYASIRPRNYQAEEAARAEEEAKKAAKAAAAAAKPAAKPAEGAAPAAKPAAAAKPAPPKPAEGDKPAA